jgi:hypothetical protein
MARRKKNYRESDVFAVPLRDGGFAVGVVACSSAGSIILGYFFGPRHEVVPTSDVACQLNPTEPVLIRLVGALGLLNGEWPIIGSIDNWESEKWPLPKFLHENPSRPEECFLVTYNRKNLNAPPVAVEPIDCALASGYPEDVMSGYGAVEIRLTRLLPKV